MNVTLQVVVGDLLLVKNNEHCPADIVLFYAANADGIAYIETSNLDGYLIKDDIRGSYVISETNLKQKRAITITQNSFTDVNACAKQGGVMHCQGPILDLYTFEGRFIDSKGESHALSNDQMILRVPILLIDILISLI